MQPRAFLAQVAYLRGSLRRQVFACPGQTLWWSFVLVREMTGVIANLAVFFGLRVLFPESGSFDAFAAVLAVLVFVVLRRFALQTYYLVPVGAAAGMIWVLLGMH